MEKKLILVLSGVSQVATKFAGMLSNSGLQTKALCPPQGLQGLVGALKSGLSHADVVLFTPDAFSKPNPVDPVSAVQALLITKPSLRVLVFRTGGMENLHAKALLKAGAASVYIGNIPSDKEFSSWVEENVFGIPTKQTYLEQKRGTIKTFSLPTSVSQEVKEIEQAESEDFSLDDEPVFPPDDSIDGILTQSHKSKKPNGKKIIHKSGLSKNKNPKTLNVIFTQPVSVEVSIPQKIAISVTQISESYSRVGFFGHEIKISNDFAEVLEFLLSANGRCITIKDIAERFDVNINTAYSKIWYLISSLNEYSADLGFCVKSNRSKGYYIELRDFP